MIDFLLETVGDCLVELFFDGIVTAVRHLLSGATGRSERSAHSLLGLAAAEVTR